MILLLFNFKSCLAWDTEQLEVFDAVEEVKGNFYEILQIPKDANEKQIKSSFRSLSLKLHPDKNIDKDTSEDFRNLVTIYDILKNPVKRKYYDEVLQNGLPNWRSAVYYYRYVRKVGMLEACILLFIILTIGQYLVYWAAYLEKQYELEQTKKKKKRSDRDKAEAVILEKPSIKDTLPFQIPRFIWYLITSIPYMILATKDVVSDQVKKKIEEASKVEEEEPIVVRPKTTRKRANKGFVIPEGPNFETNYGQNLIQDDDQNSAPVGGGLWTDDDLADLVRLTKKYPGGVSGRWEIIAKELYRSVPEVTFMANKLKENGYKLPEEQEVEAEPVIPQKQKTKKNLDTVKSEELQNAQNWSQEQQRCLETALAKFPKGSNERWERISELVPGKTKDECVIRFKFLAENLKKQKEQMSES